MRSMHATASTAGPWFDDLAVGDVIADAPAMTLTEGHAALHQAILGDRLRLPLDAPLARRVLGRDAVPAHPGLVCDVAIGQSTLFTRRVRANLFYRGLALHRLVVIGDTLRTSTRVVALRETTRRAERPATGLAVLRITTVDQEDRPVLDFLRCAMLPLRPGAPETGHAADVAAVTLDGPAPAPAAALEGVDLAAFRAALPAGRHFDAVSPGDTWEIVGGDVVSCAPELARLTLNVAIAHHDAARPVARASSTAGTRSVSPRRRSRACCRELVTIVGWEGCDHTGPVHEGDTLHSVVTVTGTEPLPGGGGLVARARSSARPARTERSTTCSTGG